MKKLLRQAGFLTYAFLLRWPIWLVIWLVGRSGILKTLFLIYPTDSSECLDFCPNIKWLRNFFSGRPTPAGLIMKGWLPIGIYLVIPNPAMELMLKKNRPMIEDIMKKMRWAKKLAGAKSVGLAGQLGPIFEKRHGIAIEPPFYSSTYGNLFSIQKAVSHLVNTTGKKAWRTSVAIVGGGFLGEQLMQYLGNDGYRMSLVDVRYTRKGDVRLANQETADQQLSGVDFVINLLPRGKDFMDCCLPDKIPASATIVDFSRPSIEQGALAQRVVMGNRVQKSRVRFCLRLPGGWKSHELPACSMPSLLASFSGKALRTIDDFLVAARLFHFQTALAPAAARQQESIFSRDFTFTEIGHLGVRLLLSILGRRQPVGR